MKTQWISAGMLFVAVAGIALIAGTHGRQQQANAAQEKDPTPAAATDEASVSQDEPKKSLLAPFMRRKLSASNKILEGLVTDDPSLIVDGADILGRMSNEEKWRASNDMMYLYHSRAFRESVDVLKQKGEKGNLDGAALAWMDVTLSCIRCHEWVRNVLIAESDDAGFKSHLEVPGHDVLPGSDDDRVTADAE